MGRFTVGLARLAVAVDEAEEKLMGKQTGVTRTGGASGPASARGGPTTPRPAGSRRPAAGRGRVARWPLFAGLAVAAVIVSAVVVFAVRSQSGGQVSAAAVEFGHVHGLAVDDVSGALYAATHLGLFRIDGARTAVRVSKEGPDLMGFTAVGPGHFLASGHPDQHGDGPANLGLIESTDGGVTWQTMSLSGAADFHGLRGAHGAVYGYNSTDGAFMVSTDRRTWERRSAAALGAFAVSPTDAQTVLAVGEAGLQRSSDGGRTWTPISGAPAVGVLAWEQDAEVWGAGRDGVVWQSADGGTTWQRGGRLPAQPHALTTDESTVFAALAGDEIVASADGGATWTRRYAPA